MIDNKESKKSYFLIVFEAIVKAVVVFRWAFGNSLGGLGAVCFYIIKLVIETYHLNAFAKLIQKNHKFWMSLNGAFRRKMRIKIANVYNTSI